MKTVYLCGPINGCSDAECKDWRESAKALLGDRFNILDPMRRDYRGREAVYVNEIVRGDYADIDASDIVLVAADAPGWGTAMELHYASLKGKVTMCFCGASRISPWLRYHSRHILTDLSQAARLITTTYA